MMKDSAGVPLGELTKDKSHIESHIEENYFVPSLLVNALKAFGASVAAEQTAHAFMQGKLEYAYSKNRGDFIAAQIQKNIRRYCLRQLGLSA
jgi:hypothetical protein